MLFIDLIILVIAFVLLWLGSKLLIKGALTISRILGLSETFVGLTLVSFCLNFPEIMITFSGAFKQARGLEASQLVIGNVVGSNMGQISLVLGLAGLLKVIKIKKTDVIYNGFALIISSFLLFVFSIDGVISKMEGILMVLFYIVYMLVLSKNSLIQKKKKKNFLSFSISAVVFRQSIKKYLKPLVELIAGAAIIILSSEMAVAQALLIAEVLNINQLIVGVFMVGLGVTLPELFVAISALNKGSVGLSVGSMLGGNIVVILMALGGTAIFSNWQIPRSVVAFDMAYLLLITVVVILFLLTRKKLERKESILILLLYVVYALLKTYGY